MSKGILVLGAGGHASVIVDVLLASKNKIVGIISPEVVQERKIFDGLNFYHDECIIYDYHVKDIFLVNGVGSLPFNNRRSDIYNKYTNEGYEFLSVLSSNAYISEYAVLGRGVQVMPGAIIQAGAVIGDNTIINTSAIIEHDCIIGCNNHIAPGATLSGGVHTGSDVHIGTNATIIQSIAIGERSVIGAGAVITKDVKEESIVYPAKVFIRRMAE
ncbi:acetyltransferase [Serratia fonticola]|uniref:acetyltransferase n=1 Tax=Serratia fonticola TaxID=47917 RepID=UPI003BB5216E